MIDSFMETKDLNREQLLAELEKTMDERDQAREMLQAIQNGEIDALVVNRGNREQIFVLDDANITYRRMIEEMSEGAVTFNSGNYILYCNKAFSRLTGYDIDEIVAKPVTNFIDSHYNGWFREISENSPDEPHRMKINLLDSNGCHIPAIISLHKYLVSGMETYLMTIVDQREKLYIEKLNLQQASLEKLASRLREARDQAEEAVKLLKEKNNDYTILNREYININNKLASANRELLLEKKKAEKSDQLKSAFVANMSHEIRTPLNSILGYTRMLMDSIDDAEQLRHIDVIMKSGRHLLHLIDDIVDLSKLEANELKIVESEVVLNDLIGGLKKQFDAHAGLKEKSRLELRISLPVISPDQAVVYADEFRIQQILNNLLGNAIKYTEKGYIEYGYRIIESKKEIEFFVKDTGAGISQEDQEIIFQRFQQGRSSSGKVLSGTGLGLAISRGLTHLLGGKIWLRSQPGAGSTFYFTIPFKPVRTKAPVKPGKKEVPATGVPQLSGKTILLSEDDLFSREMMIYMLKKTNAEMVVAIDGRETLDKFRNNKIDLVLLDLRLPEIDGYEVLREIRSMGSDVIVIAQTAYAMLDDIRKFKKVGFDDYLLKPITDTELFRMLHKYLC